MEEKSVSRKKLLIHDLETPAEWMKEGGELDMIAAAQIAKPCIGCFGCWIKTPAACVIRDGFEDIGGRIAACDEVLIVSRCVYGGFSPAVKNVLDRCIGYLLPFFTIREDGRMHHRERYPNRIRLAVHFYGADATQAERTTAERLCECNAINLHARNHTVRFHRTVAEIGRDIA